MKIQPYRLYLVLAVSLLLPLIPGSIQQISAAVNLVVASDDSLGYSRNLFKHWIDADGDGCNTRAEILIRDAIVKPKIGPKCKLSGGKWVSKYDGKTITNSSLLDVDHLVPLAEAWRSGASKWTPLQRQNFANDLENPEALAAVTLSSNRSKGDKDPSEWMPKEELCTYIKNWVTIKSKYLLTVDIKENQFIQLKWNTCFPLDAHSSIPTPKTPEVIVEDNSGETFTWVQIKVFPYEYIPGKNTQLQGFFEENIPGKSIIECFYNTKLSNKKFASSYPIFSDTNSIFCKVNEDTYFNFYTLAIEIYTNKVINPTKSEIVRVSVGTPNTATATPLPSPSASGSPAATNAPIVTPGAFCTPPGATGKSSSGVLYTCKTSVSDTRNRWRQ